MSRCTACCLFLGAGIRLGSLGARGQHLGVTVTHISHCMSSSLEPNTRNSLIGILTTAAAIAEEVRYTTVFVLPGGVHEDFIEAFELGEGTRRDGYTLMVLWLSGLGPSNHKDRS